MTEAFWWYLLAGFIVGFTLSTMWEWLYFRRRRMRIENRRIAELEAMLRTYAVAEESPMSATGSRDNWATPPFDDPGAYLDIEDDAAVAAAPPADLPPVAYKNVEASPINGNRSASTPATLPNAPPADAGRPRPQAAAIMTAGALATSLETPPPVERSALPVQTYVSARSSTFPTAAAQAIPPQSSPAQPHTAIHTLPEGVASHDTMSESPSTAFPSAATQPASGSAPIVLAAKSAQPQPASQTTPGSTQSNAAAANDDDRAPAAIAGTAGAAAVIAATHAPTEEPPAQSAHMAPAGAAPVTTGSQPITPQSNAAAANDDDRAPAAIAGTAGAAAVIAATHAPTAEPPAQSARMAPAGAAPATPGSQPITPHSDAAAANDDERAPAAIAGTAGAAAVIAATHASTAEPPAQSARMAPAGAAPATTSQPDAAEIERRNAGIAATAAVAAVVANEEREEQQASATEPTYANGRQLASEPVTSGAQPAASLPAKDPVPAPTSDPGGDATTDTATDAPITPAKIDALVASIHELIDAVNQDRPANTAEAAALLAVASQLQTEKTAEAKVETEVVGPTRAPEPVPPSRITTTEPSSRIEEALVLLIKSVGRYIRQVRSIFSGEGGQEPKLQRAVPTSDFMQLDDMTQQHVDRLRVAGITSFADLARLSEAELSMLMITPGNEPTPDYGAWIKQATDFAASERGLV